MLMHLQQYLKHHFTTLTITLNDHNDHLDIAGAHSESVPGIHRIVQR